MIFPFIKKFSLISATPSLESLHSLYQCFLRFPYENISKILKVASGCEGENRFRLPEEVWEDFLRHGLGGTCFSLSFFFKKILDDSGFNTYLVMADRSYGDNTHCAVVVILDGKNYLVDPAFLLPQPVEFGKNFLLEGKIWSYEFASLRRRSRKQSSILDRHVALQAPPDDGIIFHTTRNNQRKLRCTYKNVPVSREDFFHYWTQSFGWQGMHSVVMTQNIGDKQIYIRDTHLRVNQIGGVQKEKIDLSKIDPSALPFNIPTQLVRQAWDYLKTQK